MHRNLRSTSRRALLAALDFWRRAHQAFFSRALAQLGRRFEPDTPVVCERFRMLYPAAVADAPPPVHG